MPERSSQPRRRNDYVALLLVLLAALGYPLIERLCALMHVELAIYLPTILIVGWVCLLRPDPALPVVTLVAIYLVQLPPMLFEYGTHPSFAGRIARGQWYLLGIPVAAIALGYAAVLVRRKRPLWRWPIESELHRLAFRPVEFLKAYRVPLAVMLAGCLADMTTTIITLRQYGPRAEVHPAMRIMAEQYGVDAGIVIGTVVRVLVVLFVASLWKAWCRGLLLLCGGLYILAALNNYYLWL